MKYLTKILNWMKDNAIGIVVGGLVAVYMLANTAVIQAKTQSKKELLACKTLCFPQQSEYITHGDANSCWCYVDLETIKKSQ